MSATTAGPNWKPFREGEIVILPDGGRGEVFECSTLLGFTSVFIEGIRKAQIYETKDLKKLKP